MNIEVIGKSVRGGSRRRSQAKIRKAELQNLGILDKGQNWRPSDHSLLKY